MENFSLLYCDNNSNDYFKLDEDTIKDLEIEYLFNNILKESFNKELNEIFQKILTSKTNILYRQEIIQDLLNNKTIIDAFKKIMNDLYYLNNEFANLITKNIDTPFRKLIIICDCRDTTTATKKGVN